MREDSAPNRRDVLQAIAGSGIAITGVGSAYGRATSPAQSSGTTLKLLHDTHVHGRLGGATETENVENYFGLMDQLASDADNVLRVGAGDDLGSSALSTEFEGKHIVEAFEAGDLAHDTYGNHDFDFGPEVLRTRVGETEGFQWVSANAVDTSTGEVFANDAGAKLYDIVEVGDVSVGVTGLLTERASEVTSLGPDTIVRPPAEALAEVVPEMRSAGADVVVVLSHVANDVARTVAENVDGIDVIVGDDAAEVLGAETVNDTVLAFVGDGYDHLGEMTLTVADGQVQGHDYTLYETAEAVDDLGVQPDSAVADVATSYREQVDSEVIGRSSVPLNCGTEDLRTRETNVGNFVADTIRADVDADVVIQNGGGIRTDTHYPAGEITDLLIKQILPFGNTAVKLEVTGSTLLDALENGVSKVETLEGRFPQVSGLTFTWYPDAPPGDRVGSVTIDGESLDPSATYTLGTNNFMAGGGDGYEMLSDAPAVETGGDLAQAVIDRIEQRTPISPEVQGRITRGAPNSLALDSVSISNGSTGRVDLSLLSAMDGFSGGRFTVSVADGRVAEITDVTYADSLGMTGTPRISSEGDTVELRIADIAKTVQTGATDVRLATIELDGTAAGATELTIEVEAFDDETGSAVDVEVRNGMVVTGPPALAGGSGGGAAPTDPDDDGLYEDVNGNGRLDYSDVETLFEHFGDEAVTTNVDAYDFNDNGQIDYDDVVELYEEI